MWGIPYDEYMLLNDMSVLGSNSYDFYGFGMNGRVYAGTYLFEDDNCLFMANGGRIRVLPKALLESFMAADTVSDEMDYDWLGPDLLN